MSGSLGGHLHCFQLVQSTGKGFHNILTNLSIKLPTYKSNTQAAFSIKCFAQVGVERQTNIHTSIICPHFWKRFQYTKHVPTAFGHL